MDKWTIQKSGTIYVSSSVRCCGYSNTQIKILRKAGYNLYCNGKMVKRIGVEK